MARSYAPTDMVSLPTLSAAEAVVIATSLKSAFASRQKALEPDGEALAPSVVKAMTRMGTACAALEQALTPESVDTQAAKQADSVMDEVWGAFHDWLRGWNRLTLLSAAEQERVQALYRTVFGEGLRFLNYSYKTQWQASRARLEVLADELNRQLLTQLGGLPFGTRLVEAHRAYGEALGITKETQEEPSTEVRECFMTLLAALRDYVLKVQATVEPDDAASQTQAQALLQPLLTW